MRTSPLPRATLAAACTAAAIAAPAPAQAPSFTTFVGPGQPSGVATPRGISADGSVVVGSVDVPNVGTRAFRWTRAGGLTLLDSAPDRSAYAWGVSGDGTTPVGRIALGGGLNAVRWPAGGAPVTLGALPGAPDALAYAASHGGGVVVGYSDAGVSTGQGDQAFRWTPAGGIQLLGSLGGDTSRAMGTSADGSVVVGLAGSAGAVHPFRWTAAGGMQDLGLPAGTTAAVARAVTAGGARAIVQSIGGFAPSWRGFQWTQGQGYAPLLPLPGGVGTFATAMSGDGSTIVGLTTGPLGDVATLWLDPATPVRLADYFASMGISTPGFSPNALGPAVLSHDGRTIGGSGQYFDQSFSGLRAWVAVVPAPGAGVVGACALAGLGRRRRRA